MTDEIKFVKSGLKSESEIDILLRLGMYSLLSLTCFWFPFIFIYKYAKYDNDGRSICAFYIVFPFIIFVAIHSIILLRKFFSFLKQFNSKKRFKFAFLGIAVSLPSLIAGIFLIVSFALGIIGLIGFNLGS